MNPYYTPGSVTKHTTARAATMNAEFAKVGAGFDALHGSLMDFGRATSSTTLTIGGGEQELVIESGHFIQVGQAIIIASAALPETHYMGGIVTAYDPETGETTVNVTEYSGAGALSNWEIAITVRGAATRILEFPGSVALATLKAAMDLGDVTNAGFAAKAPLSSPALTDTPTAPTAAKATSTTQIATTAFVQANTEWTQIAQADAAGLNAVTFSSIPTHYKDLLLRGNGISTSSSVGVTIHVSSDGIGFGVGRTLGGTSTSAGAPTRLSVVFSAARGNIGPVSSGLANGGSSPNLTSWTGDTPANLWHCIGGIFAVRAILNSGNHTTGTYTLLGR